jgi:hypothetical protein
MIRIWVEKKGAGEILAASSDKIWLVRQGRDKTGKKAIDRPSIFIYFSNRSTLSEPINPVTKLPTIRRSHYNVRNRLVF